MTGVPISVVIPTHNRRASLLRALSALSRQEFDGSFEVIVSIDGSTDDTVDALEGVRAPYALRVVRSAQPCGAAAARNRGAQVASSPLIVFLDDDTEPAPALLAAHARRHASGATLTVGYLATTTPHRMDFFQIALRGWWEAMFETMRRPGHRSTFKDVLTGNCAIRADLFHRVGGFDEQFRCHEDYELGVRAIEAGATVCYARDAHAVHHELTTMPRAFARKVDEGRADVAMLRKHPHLVSALPLGVFEQYATPMEFRIRRLVFEYPAAGRIVARALTRSLAALEFAKLRGRWRVRLQALLHYWYFRGVRDHLDTLGRLKAFVRDCRSEAVRRIEWVDVDLANGLEAAMETIDAERPHGARIRYRNEDVGSIEPQPGAEPLRGTHLKGSLARELAGPFVAALGRAHAIALEPDGGQLVASGQLPAHALSL